MKEPKSINDLTAWVGVAKLLEECLGIAFPATRASVEDAGIIARDVAGGVALLCTKYAALNGVSREEYLRVLGSVYDLVQEGFREGLEVMS